MKDFPMIRSVKAGVIGALVVALPLPLLSFSPLTGLYAALLGLFVWPMALCVAGLYLLCIQGSLTLDPGDGMLMLSALAFMAHILVVDHFSTQSDCVKMSCLQFFTGALLCLLCSAIWEKPSWQAIQAAWMPVLYAGVMSCAVGYTLQIIGQRDADPTVASLVMSLESVFAVLAGWVILGDTLSGRELAGCALMMAGIVIAQLPQAGPAK